MVSSEEYEINENLVGTRIDKCIVTLDNSISRATAQRLIDEEKVLVNSKPVKASYKASLGDVVKIEKEEAKETDILAQDIPIEVLYEDDDIIVVNKPKGIVVHPACRKSRWNACKCDYEYM